MAEPDAQLQGGEAIRDRQLPIAAPSDRGCACPSRQACELVAGVSRLEIANDAAVWSCRETGILHPCVNKNQEIPCFDHQNRRSLAAVTCYVNPL